MTEEEKARYYCGTHPNLFSQKKCNGCNRGMCFTCIDLNNEYCSSCFKYSILDNLYFKSLKEIKGITIIAILVLIIAHLIQYFSNNNIYEDYIFLKNLGLTLFYTISIAYAFILFEGTDFLDDIRKIPFIGFKLMLGILILTVIAGIPVFYFVYKVFWVSKNYARYKMNYN